MASRYYVKTACSTEVALSDNNRYSELPPMCGASTDRADCSWTMNVADSSMAPPLSLPYLSSARYFAQGVVWVFVSEEVILFYRDSRVNTDVANLVGLIMRPSPSSCFSQILALCRFVSAFAPFDGTSRFIAAASTGKGHHCWCFRVYDLHGW